MSDNEKMQTSENTNEWINWIEEAIVKEHLKFYEYNLFSNFLKIGAGGFGKVYRANWKNLEKQLALKSFFNLDNITVKEIVRELKIQREVDFHDNIIRCHGITKFESENHDNGINYMLVMEYADGGSLRNYLKNNFSKLTWNNKYLMAYQLASAVSCLHVEGVVHRDLHSSNILVHQNVIKLADFGLSKRIGASSNFQSKLFGMVPYVDPKSFSRRRNNNNQMYSLNEKSDVYSIGVLLWELSSGQPPFYADGEHYDVGLIYDISQGHREIAVPDTPNKYVKIYTKCWDGEPDNRPTIFQVVDWLKAIITKTDIIIENPQVSKNQKFKEAPSSINNSESQGELSQLINNFNKMNTKEIDTTVKSDKQEKFSSEINFNSIVDEINDLIFKLYNKGIGWKLAKDQVIDYFNNHNINLQEIYNWLLNNQNNSNSIFLLGYFYYRGIETSKNRERAFNLFIIASEQDHIIAQYFAGYCYFSGTIKNEKLAFEYFEKSANKNFSRGQSEIGYFYGHGIGVEKDYNEAFKLYKQLAEEGDLDGLAMLGYCYSYGIGTNINKQKAFELYQKSANLGDETAQYSIAKCINME
ncbi:kinase-like domain-containing protein [Rhizophagus irregularis DAOM 181602=DAOM 197198]|nr:kinase-like domain-containing protein [Rhizophagus irregularis DAOM 181602=DAOM 197198]